MVPRTRAGSSIWMALVIWSFLSALRLFISFDAMCARCAIVLARYMLLVRKEQDPPTAGPIFA